MDGLEREFNVVKRLARSMYPSIFNRFPVIQAVKSLKVRHFSTFWPPWLCRAVTIAVSVTWIERKFNAGQTPRSI